MDKKLKILFLSNRVPYPIKDGQSRRTYNILKGLAERHEVYFLSLYESNDEISPQTMRHLERYCKQIEVIPSPSKKLSPSMILRLLRSLISADPYSVWRQYSPTYLRRIEKVLETNKIDLIHCDILPLAYTVRKSGNTPCTLTDHDVCYLKALRISKQSRNIPLKLFLFFESKKLRRYESKIFEHVSMGLTVSEVDKRLLNEICPKGKFAVIENGVNIDEFKPLSEDSERDTLLWVGGFGYSPNKEAIHYFLDSIYPIIKKEVPGLKLNIVGGSVTKKIKNIACCDSSINVFGYVDDPLPYIQRSAIFIVPILSGSGTRLKTLEAMAAGKAIVTTTVGCEGIEGIDKVHYLVADHPSDFAKSVVALLKNPDLRKQLGINARRLASQKYDWKIIFEKINHVYMNLKSN
jgi:glycosyltransferase involved in cell wall biosynthesis